MEVRGARLLDQASTTGAAEGVTHWPGSSTCVRDPGSSRDRSLAKSGCSLSEVLTLLDVRSITWADISLSDVCGFNVSCGPHLYFYMSMMGEVSISGSKFSRIDLQEGGVAIILSGEAHAVRTTSGSYCQLIEYFDDGVGDEPCRIQLMDERAVTARVLCGRLKLSLPSGFSPTGFPSHVTLPPGSTIVDREAMDSASRGVGSSVLLTRIASVMLTFAIRSDDRFQHAAIASTTNDPVGRAIQLVERHPEFPWSVTHLASSLGMGRTAFATRFAAEQGCGPMAMVTERRMRTGANLLRTSLMKLSEIAIRVGYRSEASFSRRFRTVFGVTPASYREMRPDLVEQVGSGMFGREVMVR